MDDISLQKKFSATFWKISVFQPKLWENRCIPLTFQPKTSTSLFGHTSTSRNVAIARMTDFTESHDFSQVQLDSKLNTNGLDTTWTKRCDDSSDSTRLRHSRLLRISAVKNDILNFFHLLV